MAFFHYHSADALRKALQHRSRVQPKAFKPGDMVYVYREVKTKGKRASAKWLGLATVIGPEGSNYWVAPGGRCLLAAGEHDMMFSAMPDHDAGGAGSSAPTSSARFPQLDEQRLARALQAEERHRAATHLDDVPVSVKRRLGPLQAAAPIAMTENGGCRTAVLCQKGQKSRSLGEGAGEGNPVEPHRQ